MSIQALNWALSQDQIKNSGTRFILLVLCNYANESGQCYPSRETLAKKTSMTARSVQTHLNWLSDNGYIKWVNQRSSSRQGSNLYQIQSENFSLSHENREIPQSEDISLSKAPQGENFARQGENFDISQGENISPNTKEREPSSTTKVGKGDPPSRKSPKPLDPRQDHPAIIALRDLSKLFPPKELWDTIIDELGDTPDLDRLRSCFIEWRTRDFRPTNYAWAREWYIHGIPHHPGYLGRPYRPATKVVPVESDDLPAPTQIRDRRPAVDSPPEHRELWRSVLDGLRPRMSPQVFDTWFGSMIFDGLNDEMNAFRIRADQVTKDWVTRYYSEAIYETLTALGLGEFTFQWESEDEFEEAVAL